MKVHICFVVVCAMILGLAFSPMAEAQEVTVLKNNEKAKSSTKEAGQYFKFVVPEGTILFTLWTYSADKRDGMDLYMNGPQQKDLPTTQKYQYRSASAGNVERLALTAPSAGDYVIYLTKVQQGCDFDITARAQTATALKHDEESKASMDDDGADNSKFFYFDVPEGMDMLRIWTTSLFKGDGLDLYVSNPDLESFPDKNTYWGKSANASSFENIYVTPHNPPKAGRYRVKAADTSARCSSFTIQWKAEKIAELQNGEPKKFTTREPGEYIVFEAPAGMKELKIATSTIVNSDITDLYVNGPQDESFPTTNEYRWKSAKSGVDTIIVDNPKEGKYYIYIKNVGVGKPYEVTATCQ